MTALSIPERAREIAERQYEAWLSSTESIRSMVEDTATKALRSERELCAKELEGLGAFHLATLLREGGQK